MNNKMFSECDKINMDNLPSLNEIQRLGYLVNRMLNWIIKRDQINEPCIDRESIRPLSSSAEQFRKEIWDHYEKDLKESRKPSRFPSGPLVDLNPAEYYAYCLKQELKQLKLQKRD